MIHQRIPPPPSLADHVRYFWTLDSTDMPYRRQVFGPLADGCPGLIFQCATQGQFYTQDDKPLSELFIYGQSVQQVTLLFSGRFRLTGVCLWPHTLKAIAGLDACELTDTCFDLTNQAEGLLEKLSKSRGIHQQISQLTHYLLAQIRRTCQPLSQATGQIVTQLMQTGGSLPLHSIRTRLGLSERSLERNFQQQVGIAPKLFANICRFQASLHQLTTHDYRQLVDVAYTNGYADQSHFIRSFKLFAGQTPTQFRQQAPTRIIPSVLAVYPS